MDDKRLTQKSNSVPQDFPPCVDVTTTAHAEQKPCVRIDDELQLKGKGAVQQSFAQGSRGASQPNEDRQFQQKGVQFTEYRNPMPAHRQQTSAWSARASSGGAFKKNQKPRVAFNFRCGKCPRLVCAGADVRVFMSKHHPVLDPTFIERIKVYRHWKPETIGESQRSLKLPIEKVKKIACVDCESDWGVGVTMEEKFFFFIKIDTLKVERDGTVKEYNFWGNLPYHLDTIDDSDLMPHGRVWIPDDSPWPQGWY